MLAMRHDRAHRPPDIASRLTRVEDLDTARQAYAAWRPATDYRVIESPWLSIVVPSRNEAMSLTQLVAEIVVAMEFMDLNEKDPRRSPRFEIVIVDDGSTDETQAVLSELSARYPELRPIRLANRAGQSAATIAGIRYARGQWIATLDADLQNNPVDLVRLWSALPGHDAALGWRVKRQDHWSKRLTGRLANWMRNAVLNQSIRDTGCSVRIFSRARALCLPSFDGVHRFIGPLLLREGCSLVQVAVSHRPRAHGRSHYNLWNRMVRVVVDLIGVYWLQSRPLRYQVLSGAMPVMDVDLAVDKKGKLSTIGTSVR